MTHNSNHHTPEADKPMGVDRSLLEFLKPKAEERYSKLEAYCDLLRSNVWCIPSIRH